MNERETKGERREKKRDKKRKMRMSGKGVQNVQRIWEKRANKIKEKE